MSTPTRSPTCRSRRIAAGAGHRQTARGGRGRGGGAIEERSATGRPRLPRRLDRWWPFRDRAWQHTAHAFGFLPAGRNGRRAAARSRRSAPCSRPGAAKQPGQDRAQPAAGGGLPRRRHPPRAVRLLRPEPGARQRRGAALQRHLPGARGRARRGRRLPDLRRAERRTGGRGFPLPHRERANDADEAFLDLSEGDAFKAGLKLATTAQPAIAPLANMALGMTKAVATRNRNVAGARLLCRPGLRRHRHGRAPGAGRLHRGADPGEPTPVSGAGTTGSIAQQRLIVEPGRRGKLIPYNYVVFGVSRYEG